MTWVRRAWSRLSDWIRRQPRLEIALTAEPPDLIARNTIYLVGEGEPWCAVMLCPCSCGAEIRLSLVQDDNPTWSVRTNAEGHLTIYPSIWRIKGCKSHFFVFRSRVVWARSSNLRH